MSLIPANPDLSNEEKKAWEEAQRKIKFANNPPLKTVELKDAGTHVFGDLKRIETITSVKAPPSKQRVA